MTIAQNVARLIQELPHGVRLLAAAKTRTPAEVRQAVAAGITIIGENYVQEAEAARPTVGPGVAWHFIGHLQKNKVKKAVELFDMIETVDSAALAREIHRRCSQIGRTMPVLIEVNSGREPQKSGVFPEDAEALVSEIAPLGNIRIMGLMTMGPLVADPGELRPCFSATRQLFERIRSLNIPNVTMEYLSMGMTDSYRLAVEEGANLVRIGSLIFGKRSY